VGKNGARLDLFSGKRNRHDMHASHQLNFNPAETPQRQSLSPEKIKRDPNPSNNPFLL
jgi:hypothetical protein